MALVAIAWHQWALQSMALVGIASHSWAWQMERGNSDGPREKVVFTSDGESMQGMHRRHT